MRQTAAGSAGRQKNPARPLPFDLRPTTVKHQNGWAEQAEGESPRMPGDQKLSAKQLHARARLMSQEYARLSEESQRLKKTFEELRGTFRHLVPKEKNR